MKSGKRQRRRDERNRQDRFRRRVAIAAVAALVVIVAAVAWWNFPSRWVPANHPPVLTPELKAASTFPPPAALACQACHEKEFQAWSHSQHAHANRLLSDEDREAFARRLTVREGPFTTRVGMTDGRFSLATAADGEKGLTFFPEAVIGISPLRQYLLPFPGGRWQTLDVSYDPIRKEWFNSQGSSHFSGEDWGFWKNRGMTWNVQCAFCHMTGLEKNYDIASDTYATTWDAMGISCAQCHGPMTDHLKNPQAPVAALAPDRVMDNCGSCHARREELTGRFHAGESFNDHFRLTLPELPHLYWADGQVRDEDFEYMAFQFSRMAHKGIRCMDCHEPHSAGLRVPAENNALCFTCHAPPGARGAIPIDLATHSHHPPGSIGDRCISCHMPVTEYMARDPRRDHSFNSPDPLLTKELGIPNACNRCHKDQSPDWALQHVDQWYGKKMERRTRTRARAIVRAWERDDTVLPKLLELISDEEIDAWRATLIALLEPWIDRPEARKAAESNLGHANPMVRAAAVRALRASRANAATLEPLLDDPTRVVRLDAAWAQVQAGQPERADSEELKRSLQISSDQPAGALRQAEFALAQDRPEDAVRWARRAAAWDASSAEAHRMLALILHTTGNSAEAVEELEKASALEPGNADLHYMQALVLGELQRIDDVISQLEKTIALAPNHPRAHYNLGLALAQKDQLPAAVVALREAERLMPDSPDAAYALATVYLRMGDPVQARAAAGRALRIAPGHPQTLQLLRSM